MKAKKFPIDFDAINKGDEISTEQIEAIYGVRRDSAKFAIKKMTLANKIEEQMDARGQVVTVRCCVRGIRILTDSEASEHNSHETKRAIKKMGRCLTRISGVDPTEFKDDEKRAHDHRIAVVGTTYIAARGAWAKTVKLLPSTRTVPSMEAK